MGTNCVCATVHVFSCMRMRVRATYASKRVKRGERGAARSYAKGAGASAATCAPTAGGGAGGGGERRFVRAEHTCM